MRRDTVSFLLLTLGVCIRGHEDTKSHHIFSSCGEDAVLRCSAPSQPGVLYRSVIWYKVDEASPSQLTGLVMKKLTHNGTVQRYKGFERKIELLMDSHGLYLPNVTLQDAGKYRCLLSAPVGHQNQKGDVHLTIYDCLYKDVEEADKNDTLYVTLAIILLALALLMLLLSYIYLKNTLIGLSKKTWLLKTNQMKGYILKLESKGASKLLPQEYV